MSSECRSTLRGFRRAKRRATVAMFSNASRAGLSRSPTVTWAASAGAMITANECPTRSWTSRASWACRARSCAVCSAADARARGNLLFGGRSLIPGVEPNEPYQDHRHRGCAAKEADPQRRHDRDHDRCGGEMRLTGDAGPQSEPGPGHGERRIGGGEACSSAPRPRLSPSTVTRLQLPQP